MSSDDRPATRAFKDRWTNLRPFWKERRRGPYDRDFTEWRIEMGLTPRTAKESYWDAGETLGIIRIVYEKKQKFWEYCTLPSDEEIKPKRKLSAKAEEFFEKCRIKEKMKTGPCAHGCVLSEDADCRECSVYYGLRNKDFLEHEAQEKEKTTVKGRWMLWDSISRPEFHAIFDRVSMSIVFCLFLL